MTISSTHPEYSARIDQWTRCRDVVEGSDAVKNKGETYLPKLGGQTPTEYGAYKTRALFFSAAGRSLQGFVGTVTRRDPKYAVPEEMDVYFKDITGSGTSFSEIFKDITFEVMLEGRYGLLIDWPVDGGRSYVVTYGTEQIINWFVSEDGQTLEGVILMEEELEQVKDDPFERELVTRYRHLYLNDGGNYTVSVYNDKEEIVSTVIPTVRGEAIQEIPMVIVNPFGIAFETIKPPLLDLVDLNLSLYLTCADLEHGRHFTALPTPVISGAPADTKLKIGSQTAWALPDFRAKAYYLEFLGAGLQSLEKAISEKMGQMAQFSARLMDTSTRGSEAVDTVRLRHSSESATLSGVAIAIESALNTTYRSIARYDGIDESEVTIVLYKDFLASKLSAAEMRELTKAYLEGAIDEETYQHNLDRGELLPETKQAIYQFNTGSTES